MHYSCVNNRPILVLHHYKVRKREPRENEEGTKMKNLGLATIAAAGLMAAVLGFAGPANADIGHHDWVNDLQPTVSVPHVDTVVQQSH